MATKRVLTAEERHILTLPFDFKYYCDLRQSMEQGEEEDICPFCYPDHKKNPVLYENSRWWITKNAFPNNRACSVMLLIIPKKHWRLLGDISLLGWFKFGMAIWWSIRNYKLTGGMLFLRFGDMLLNGGTIRHLHWNLWVPDTTGKVWAPIYKSEEELEADRMRTSEYAKRYEAGERP